MSMHTRSYTTLSPSLHRVMVIAKKRVSSRIYFATVLRVALEAPPTQSLLGVSLQGEKTVVDSTL